MTAALMVVGTTSASAGSIYFSSASSYRPDRNLDVWDVTARAVPSKNLLGFVNWAECGSIYVADSQKDGLFVRGEVDYPDRDVPKRRHHEEVVTHRGAGTHEIASYTVGCGVPVNVRICVESLGCSKWYELRPMRPGTA